MEQPHRQCRTCRYFQPAPLRGKGWCHHPFWYTPQHQRLVNARGIECRRPFGDYWKARVDEMGDEAPPAPTAPPREQGVVYEFVPGLARLRWSLRPFLVAAPVVILLLLVATLWLPWRPADQADTGGASRPAATMQAVVTVAPTAATTPASVAAVAPTTPPSPTPAPPSPTASVAVERQPTAVAAVEPTAAPAPPTATAVPAPPTPEPEPQAAAEPPPAPARPSLDVGASAIVTSGNLRLRVRNAPNMSGTIVGRISDGEQLNIVGGPRQADGETWWQIRYSSLSGWVSGAFLQPAR